jgi:hypothetical protein
MAIVLKGKFSGKRIKISQYSNDWVTDEDNNVFSPSNLQYTLVEFEEIYHNA